MVQFQGLNFCPASNSYFDRVLKLELLASLPSSAQNISSIVSAASLHTNLNVNDVLMRLPT